MCRNVQRGPGHVNVDNLFVKSIILLIETFVYLFWTVKIYLLRTPQYKSRKRKRKMFFQLS